MTIQELIDKLLLIDNKNRQVNLGTMSKLDIDADAGLQVYDIQEINDYEDFITIESMKESE